MLRIGDWRADPVSGEIVRNGETARVELRTMRLLVCLAEHAGETVSIDELLNNVWPEVTVSSDSVYQAVATLRRLLGDDPKHPAYIANVPRLGYRLVAAVGPWRSKVHAGTPASASCAELMRRNLASHGGTDRPGLIWPRRRRSGRLAAAWVLHYRLPEHRWQSPDRHGSPAQKSVAVLPFLDLTEGMRNEEFADGMTEELIDRLSKIRGCTCLQRPRPFSSKTNRWRWARWPKTSASRTCWMEACANRGRGCGWRHAWCALRTAIVMWSETYDRTVDDLLAVQDDIAGDVTRALAQSIEGQRVKVGFAAQRANETPP